MARKKELYLVIDTETCNTLEQPFVYDIGYAVCDRYGNIFTEKSFVVAETFLDNKDLMKSAYYSEKIPMYWEDIKQGKRVVKTLLEIRKTIHQDMKKYNIKKVGAYNMNFDKRALNTTLRYTSKSFLRWFFPYGTDYFCIWHMACQTLMNSTSYVKFAMANGLLTASDNILTNAECCYQWLKKQIDFKESHTGLEDVRIEVEIMAKCYSTHKKMDKAPYSACWRIPQKKYKELGLREVFK